MGDEQGQQSQQQQPHRKSLLQSLRDWISKRNKDRYDSSQEEGQSYQINRSRGTFIKDYGFQIIAIAINATLAWYTARLYKQATSQSESARISANAARDAVAQYRRANDFAKEAFDINNQTSAQNLSLGERSLQTQIGSVKTTEKDFEIANTPFLQVYCTVDTVREGKPMRLKVKLENYGNYPAKIIDYKQTAGAFPQDSIEDFQKIQVYYHGKNDTTPFLNQYIVKGDPYEGSIGGDSTNTLTKDQMQCVEKNKMIMYYIGYFRYQNLVTKHIRLYKFRLEMEFKTGEKGEFRVNDNIDISPKAYKNLVPNW